MGSPEFPKGNAVISASVSFSALRKQSAEQQVSQLQSAEVRHNKARKISQDEKTLQFNDAPPNFLLHKKTANGRMHETQTATTEGADPSPHSETAQDINGNGKPSHETERASKEGEVSLIEKLNWLSLAESTVTSQYSKEDFLSILEETRGLTPAQKLLIRIIVTGESPASSLKQMVFLKTFENKVAAQKNTP